MEKRTIDVYEYAREIVNAYVVEDGTKKE